MQIAAMCRSFSSSESFLLKIKYLFEIYCFVEYIAYFSTFYFSNFFSVLLWLFFSLKSVYCLFVSHRISLFLSNKTGIFTFFFFFQKIKREKNKKILFCIEDMKINGVKVNAYRCLNFKANNFS